MVTILIVEDEQSVLGLERDILRGKGYSIISAKNAAEALKLLETVKPDLVVTDMMMPEISGAEFVRKLRNNKATAELKVILVSALNISDIGKDELRKLKVSGFIEKPFDIKDFVKKIEKALSGEKTQF